MSEKTEDNGQLGDAEFPDIDEQMSIVAAKPSRASLLLSLAALVLSVVAVIAAVYSLSSAEPVQPAAEIDTSAIDALAETVAKSEQRVADLSRRLGEIADRETATSSQLQQFRQQLESRLDIYESLPARIDKVENSVVSIQGISSGTRDTWLLAEAEYYMQIANAQLQLGANPRLARLALLQADERLQQLANPALTNVRRTLSNELRALEVMDQPDIEGISLTLASLAGVVDALPLRRQIDIDSNAEPASDSELSGLDRAIESFKSSVGGVVSVRRTDENVRPLIAPESAYFLRTNLSLQLQTARLALLRAEKSVFQQSLDDADAWLAEYYDADSAQVQSAQLTIAEIRDSLFDIAAPDISESLRMLRQFNALAAGPPPDSAGEANTEAPAEASDETQPES